MNRRIKSIAAGLAVASAATVVSAEIINVNFMADGRGSTSIGTSYFMNSTTASMPVAYDGSTWNDSEWGAATQTSMTDLLDTEGNATAVDLTLSGGANYSGDAIAMEVLKEYRYFSGNAGTVGVTLTLTGLGANGQWDIYLLSQGNANGRTTRFGLGSGSLAANSGIAKNDNSNPLIQDASPANYTNSTWTVNGNYVKFASATADASGTIVIEAASLSGNNAGSLNGIQLVAIPEPATMGMVALTGLGLFVARRFRV